MNKIAYIMKIIFKNVRKFGEIVQNIIKMRPT